MPRTAEQKNLEGISQQVNLFSTFTQAINKKPDLPDIVTFAEHPSFLNKRLYPRQKTLLRLIYLDTEHMTNYDQDVIDHWAGNLLIGPEREGVSPDIWRRIEWLKQNDYSHFREILTIIGRRGGKGHLGAICAAYQNWKLIQLDDPQWYYGIDRNRELYNFCIATNLQQAKQYQFSDLASAIIDAPCFQPYIADAKEYFIALRTPSDIRRAAELEARKVRQDRLIASVRNIAISSNSKAARGASAFCLSPQTPILKEDGEEEVALNDVQVGDKLAGVEEVSYGVRKKTETVVLAKWHTKKKCFKITFEDGTYVICSEDHKWLDDNGEWRDAKEFKVGEYIEEFSTLMAGKK